MSHFSSLSHSLSLSFFLLSLHSLYPLAIAQEAQTLPPPCPLQGSSSNFTPGVSRLSFPFSVKLLNGSSITFDGSLPNHSLFPLVVVVLDLHDDYGALLLSTDEVSVDDFLLRGPPNKGAYMFASVQSSGGGGGGGRRRAGSSAHLPTRSAATAVNNDNPHPDGAQRHAAAPPIQDLEELFLQRMKALSFSPLEVEMWMDRMLLLADAAANLPPPISSVLASWPSPRLDIGLQSSSAADTRFPRLDGANECFMTPYAVEVDELAPPVLQGCDPSVRNNTLMAGRFLLVNASDPATGGSCPPAAAVAWAQALAPAAKGVIVGVAQQPGSSSSSSSSSFSTSTTTTFSSSSPYSSPSPWMLGRNCTDVFYDDPFIPSLISSSPDSPESPSAFTLFAKEVSGGMPSNFSFNYTCDWGYGFVVDDAGVLNHLGWRKVNTLLFYAWERDMIDYRQNLEDTAATAALTVPILLPNTTINPAAQATIVLSPSVVRGYTLAAFDFRLTCASSDEAGCGPWDRIISATATCSPITSSPAANATEEIEVARWITPFRRNTGRWHTSAAALLGLVGNGTLDGVGIGGEWGREEEDAEEETSWQCAITVDVCCELWTATLDLLLFNEPQLAPPLSSRSASSPSSMLSPSSLSSPSSFTSSSSSSSFTSSSSSSSSSSSLVNSPPSTSPSSLSSSTADSLPFQVTAVVYPNMGTTFDRSYNLNRTAYVVTPANAVRAQLFALISGHGANPPPPVDVGCEYAPTSHAWSINGQGALDKYNTSLLAYQQYMQAGTPSGCQEKLRIGVIANQHGDYPDGRNGWCPGWAVFPVVVDVTQDFDMHAGAVNSVTYHALSYYVGKAPDWIPYNPSEAGCGGDIVMSTSVLWYS